MTVHPAALVLADHQPTYVTRSAADPAVCDCGWRGALCDHPAHLAEVLDRAGLLAGSGEAAGGWWVTYEQRLRRPSVSPATAVDGL